MNQNDLFTVFRLMVRAGILMQIAETMTIIGVIRGLNMATHSRIVRR